MDINKFLIHISSLPVSWHCLVSILCTLFTNSSWQSFSVIHCMGHHPHPLTSSELLNHWNICAQDRALLT